MLTTYLPLHYDKWGRANVGVYRVLVAVTLSVTYGSLKTSLHLSYVVVMHDSLVHDTIWYQLAPLFFIFCQWGRKFKKDIRIEKLLSHLKYT